MAKARTRKTTAWTGKELAVRIARIADEMNCRDVVVYELGDRSQVAEYFVIGGGGSARQLRSTAEEIEKVIFDEHESRPWHTEGYEGGVWVLMDYVDVVVHLFDPAARQYYDLESIWGDAPKVEWAETGKDRTKRTED